MYGDRQSTLLVNNCTEDEVRVYFYNRLDPFCKMSLETMLIPPGQSRRSCKTSRKFQVYRGGVKLTEPSVFIQDTQCDIRESDILMIANTAGHLDNQSQTQQNMFQRVFQKRKADVDDETPRETETEKGASLSGSGGSNEVDAVNPFQPTAGHLDNQSQPQQNMFQRVFEKRKAYYLLVTNSSQYDVTVYLYNKLNFFYKLTTESIIINRDQTRRKRTSLAFQIYRNKKELTEPRFLEHDTFCEILDNDLTMVSIEDESEAKRSLQLAERYENFVVETTSGGMTDFYKVLGLNMAKIRAMSYEDQTREIRKAYFKLSLLYHPDRHIDDPEYNRDIWNAMVDAYNELDTAEERVNYHNIFDFKQSYVSKAFWRSLFWAEVYCLDETLITKARIKLCLRRVVYFSGAVTMIGGGLALGSAAGIPATIAGFSLLSGGISAIGSSLQLDMSPAQWLRSAGIGCAAGAVTGGVVGGAQALMLGAVGVVAATKAGVGTQVALGVITAGTAGATSSLAGDSGRYLNGEEITLKGTLKRAALTAIAAMPIGLVGAGIAAGTNFHISKILANTNLDEAAIAMFFRRALLRLYSKVIPIVGEGLAKLLVHTPINFIEDRLDESSENRGLLDHVTESARMAGTEALLDTAAAVGGGVVEAGNQTSNEQFIGKLKSSNIRKRRGLRATPSTNKKQSEASYSDDQKQSDASYKGDQEGHQLLRRSAIVTSFLQRRSETVTSFLQRRSGRSPAPYKGDQKGYLQLLIRDDQEGTSLKTGI